MNSTNRGIKLDSNFFEVSFTVISMLIAMGLALLYMPANVPLNIVSYLGMAGVLGFVFGFLISGGIVSVFKKTKNKYQKIK
jgi:hypothetical protein